MFYIADHNIFWTHTHTHTNTQTHTQLHTNTHTHLLKFFVTLSGLKILSIKRNAILHKFNFYSSLQVRHFSSGALGNYGKVWLTPINLFK